MLFGIFEFMFLIGVAKVSAARDVNPFTARVGENVTLTWQIGGYNGTIWSQLDQLDIVFDDASNHNSTIYTSMPIRPQIFTNNRSITAWMDEDCYVDCKINAFMEHVKEADRGYYVLRIQKLSDAMPTQRRIQLQVFTQDKETRNWIAARDIIPSKPSPSKSWSTWETRTLIAWAITEKAQTNSTKQQDDDIDKSYWVYSIVGVVTLLALATLLFAIWRCHFKRTGKNNKIGRTESIRGKEWKETGSSIYKHKPPPRIKHWMEENMDVDMDNLFTGRMKINSIYEPFTGGLKINPTYENLLTRQETEDSIRPECATGCSAPTFRHPDSSKLLFAMEKDLKFD